MVSVCVSRAPSSASAARRPYTGKGNGPTRAVIHAICPSCPASWARAADSSRRGTTSRTCTPCSSGLRITFRSPTATCTSSVAIGRSSRDRHTVRPPLVVLPAATPFATPVHPAGTSSANVKAAALGSSLHGKTIASRRLPGGRGAVGRDDEHAKAFEHRRAGDRLRGETVHLSTVKGSARGDRRGRGDDEFGSAAAEGGGSAVDRHRLRVDLR